MEILDSFLVFMLLAAIGSAGILMTFFVFIVTGKHSMKLNYYLLYFIGILLIGTCGCIILSLYKTSYL